MRTLVQGGELVTAGGVRRADVLIDGETIAAIGTGLDAAGAEVVDASGCVVLPGLVDNHTHMAMPTTGTVTCDDFDSGTRAALAGGTTTIVDFALQTGGSLLRGLETWHEKAAGRAHCDYGFHLAISDANGQAVAEMGRAVEEGVSTFKVFMAFKGAFMVDDEQLLRVLRRTGETGGMLQVHAENGDAIELYVQEALAAGNTAPRFHSLTRPAEAEAEATGRAIRLAAWARRPLFVVHVSCEGAVREVQAARDRGEPVFAETCVQYLTLTAEELERPGYDAAQFVCSPPLRTEHDQEVLFGALRQGALESVSTDPCPFTLEQKALHDRAIRTGRMTWPELVALTSTNPARRFGLAPRKGELAPGADGDVVVFDPAVERTISAATHVSASDYDCYEGWTVRGAPRTVLSRGEVVVRDGEVVSSPGRGRYLKRGCVEA
jgi:dihydropyrimidinase